MRWVGLVLLFFAEFIFLRARMERWMWWIRADTKKINWRYYDKFTRIFYMAMGIACIGAGIFIIVGIVPWTSGHAMNWYGALIIIGGVLLFALRQIKWSSLSWWAKQDMEIEETALWQRFFTRFDTIHRIYLMILGAGLIVSGFLVLFGVID